MTAITSQKYFSHLMMKGQVRAVCSVDHGENKQSGVLDASACIASGSKTVFDVLKEKHPDPSQSSVHSFLQCSELLPIPEVDLHDKFSHRKSGQTNPRLC